MEQGVLSVLGAWEPFYVIIGPTAAVLIGLQFVVIVLSAEQNGPGGAASVNAFGTPTIVHFCVVLLVAAILTAPWPALEAVGAALGLCGVGGLVYGVMVVRRARRQQGYKPVLEDWIWHGALPLVAYAALLIAAAMLVGEPVLALFLVGATMLLLLFIGIHNSWDAVVYIALRLDSEPSEDQK